MIKKILVFMIIGLIGGLYSLLFWLDTQQAPDIRVTTCTLYIQVYTQPGTHSHSNSNSKYNILGSVVLDDAHSKFDRNLESFNYPITLYFVETDIHFVVTTQDGYIFGDGKSEKNLKICDGKAKGKQSGPVLGDKGFWLGNLKRIVTIIHPPTLRSKLPKWFWLALGGMLVMFLVGWFMGKLYAKDE